MAAIEVSATSENTVLITWPEQVCPKQHQHILAFEALIRIKLPALIVESVISYNSIMLYYHFDQLSYGKFKHYIHDCLAQAEKTTNKTVDINSAQLVEIPVCYSKELGWDLIDVAQQCKLSIEQVIELHSQQTYRAYALGFTPGFCYLASLTKQLNLPRKATPRLNVPKGAVAIAEQQTAVYPVSSPGGWHIIGQTPFEMYAEQNGVFQPFIKIGQSVKFTPISLAKFNELSTLNASAIKDKS